MENPEKNFASAKEDVGVISAAEFLAKHCEVGGSWSELMIQFAKLHVKAALRQAEQNVYEDDGASVTSNIILTAYPLENIK